MHIELFTMFYCPACKSQEIYALAGGYIGQIYVCKECGYRGSFVLEIDEAGSGGGEGKNDKDRK
jgi:transposase-like protein